MTKKKKTLEFPQPSSCSLGRGRALVHSHSQVPDRTRREAKELYGTQLHGRCEEEKPARRTMDDPMGAAEGPAGEAPAADRCDTPCQPAGRLGEPPAVTVTASSTASQQLEEGAGNHV